MRLMQHPQRSHFAFTWFVARDPSVFQCSSRSGMEVTAIGRFGACAEGQQLALGSPPHIWISDTVMGTPYFRMAVVYSKRSRAKA
jgi:hypothetical protein